MHFLTGEYASVLMHSKQLKYAWTDWRNVFKHRLLKSSYRSWQRNNMKNILTRGSDSWSLRFLSSFTIPLPSVCWLALSCYLGRYHARLPSRISYFDRWEGPELCKNQMTVFQTTLTLYFSPGSSESRVLPGRIVFCRTRALNWFWLFSYISDVLGTRNHSSISRAALGRHSEQPPTDEEYELCVFMSRSPFHAPWAELHSEYLLSVFFRNV